MEELLIALVCLLILSLPAAVITLLVLVILGRQRMARMESRLDVLQTAMQHAHQRLNQMRQAGGVESEQPVEESEQQGVTPVEPREATGAGVLARSVSEDVCKVNEEAEQGSGLDAEVESRSAGQLLANLHDEVDEPEHESDGSVVRAEDECDESDLATDSKADVVPVGAAQDMQRESVSSPDTGVKAGAVETWLSGRMMVYAGGVVLAIGMVFLVGHMMHRNWVPPAVRCMFGAAFGLALLCLAWWQRLRWNVGAQAMGGAGVVALFATVLASSRLYELVPVPLALILTAVIALSALVLVRRIGPAVGLIGMGGGMVLPLVLGLADMQPAVMMLYVGLLASAGLAARRHFKNAWVGRLAGGLAMLWLLSFLGIKGLSGGERLLHMLLCVGLMAALAIQECKVFGRALWLVGILPTVVMLGHMWQYDPTVLDWTVWSLLLLGGLWLLRSQRMWLPLVVSLLLVWVFGLVSMLDQDKQLSSAFHTGAWLLVAIAGVVGMLLAMPASIWAGMRMARVGKALEGRSGLIGVSVAAWIVMPILHYPGLRGLRLGDEPYAWYTWGVAALWLAICGGCALRFSRKYAQVMLLACAGCIGMANYWMDPATVRVWVWLALLGCMVGLDRAKKLKLLGYVAPACLFLWAIDVLPLFDDVRHGIKLRQLHPEIDFKPMMWWVWTGIALCGPLLCLAATYVSVRLKILWRICAALGLASVGHLTLIMIGQTYDPSWLHAPWWLMAHQTWALVWVVWHLRRKNCAGEAVTLAVLHGALVVAMLGVGIDLANNPLFNELQTPLWLALAGMSLMGMGCALGLAWGMNRWLVEWRFVGAVVALGQGLLTIWWWVRFTFHPQSMLLEHGVRAGESLALTGAYLAAGLLLVPFALKRKSLMLRYMALSVVLFAGCKVFVWDMRHTGGMMRVLSFMGLGVVLLLMGWIWQRYVLRVNHNEA